MGEDISITAMKKALKEAGIQDLNISQEELMEVYNVINNSKNTAELDESRRKTIIQSDNEDTQEEIVTEPVVQTKEKPFTPKTFKATDNDSPIETEELFDIRDTIKNLQSIGTDIDATQYTFGFNDMLELAEDTNPFVCIDRELKYTSVQNATTFLKANGQKKAKTLYAYFTKTCQIKSKFTRNLFKFAPKPEPIRPKAFSSASDHEDFESNETYICRSGRQTKKRNYCYDEDSLEAASPKKSKSQDEDEGEWLNKSNLNKPEPKGKRIAKKLVNNNNNNNESAEVNHNTLDSVNNVSSTETVNNSSQKLVHLRKLNNSDIMRRSKLFQESPRSPRNSTRSEILFDNLVNEQEKKKKEEEEIEKFKRTLEQVDQENEVENNNKHDEIIEVDFEPVPRRVVPPIPGRKAINSRSRKHSSYSPLGAIVNKSKGRTVGSSQEFEHPPPLRRKKVNIKKPEGTVEGQQPSTSQNDENYQDCPICNKSFPNSQIQEHASSCGEMEESSTSPVSKKDSKIMCEICDKVVPLDTDYEVHVNECLKAQQSRN